MRYDSDDLPSTSAMKRPRQANKEREAATGESNERAAQLFIVYWLLVRGSFRDDLPIKIMKQETKEAWEFKTSDERAAMILNACTDFAAVQDILDPETDIKRESELFKIYWLITCDFHKTQSNSMKEMEREAREEWEGKTPEERADMIYSKCYPDFM